MKFITWTVVFITLVVCFVLAQQDNRHLRSNDVVVTTTPEEAAGVVLLTFLSADKDDKEGLEIAESYLTTQMGFDPNSEQDQKDMAKIRSVVQKYTEELKVLNDEADSEHDHVRFGAIQKIAKLQKDSAKVFLGTKAFFKVKQVEKVMSDPEN